LAPEAAKAFWLSERSKIKTVKNGDVYVGLTRYNENDIGFNGYLTSVQVDNFLDMPQGFSKDTFEASLCAKFRYIGQHHYMEINRNAACSMYEAITKFTHAERSNYRLLNDKVFFERIDTSLYDGTYCQMEWYAPVEEK
jgi:AraC family transcriptional regulator